MPVHLCEIRQCEFFHTRDKLKFFVKYFCYPISRVFETIFYELEYDCINDNENYKYPKFKLIIWSLKKDRITRAHFNEAWQLWVLFENSFRVRKWGFNFFENFENSDKINEIQIHRDLRNWNLFFITIS